MSVSVFYERCTDKFDPAQVSFSDRAPTLSQQHGVRPYKGCKTVFRLFHFAKLNELSKANIASTDGSSFSVT